MKTVKQTQGLYIDSIKLQSVNFSVLRLEDASAKRLQTEQETTLVGRVGDKLEVKQLLRVAGFSGEQRIWEAVCEHIGEFRLTQESTMAVEQVVAVHAPSYLYAFGRELLCDLVRRSLKILVLPPAAFADVKK